MASLGGANALSSRVMLASAMHAQPGVYALLLGSGVSTGAGIPTGWGIVQNLIERIATAKDPADTTSQELARNDPEAWWDQHGTGPLGYSTLLAALAPGQAARQGLLENYFVPTDEDRENGLKVPGPAHLAVAELVKIGAVKVVLTTNFDRLIEQALDSVGVHYQVLSRPEAAKAMTPLPHARATVVKLHGDYADLDTRNTIDELDHYPPEWTELLGRVFADYGLLISGWSGDWDSALVAALESTPRRYPLYWDSRSSTGHKAKQLLGLHQGHVLEADSADTLFVDLTTSIEALTRLAEPPLTTAMAIARLKRALPDPVRRIELHDLVLGRVSEIRRAQLPPFGPTYAEVDVYLDSLLEATKPLLAMLIEGVRHDIDGAHTALWVEVIQQLLDSRRFISGQNPHQSSLQHYPALLALRTMSLVAVHRHRDELLVRLLTEPHWADPMRYNERWPAAHVLHLHQVIEISVNELPRWNGTKWLYPPGHLLRAALREVSADYLPVDADYKQCCEDVEYRTGLVQQLLQEGYRSAYRANDAEFVAWEKWGDESGTVAAEDRFRRDLIDRGDLAWVKLFADRPAEEVLLDYREVLKNYRRFG
ncbi:SIR2 family protein [Nocardia salmonicida]|uniref:SIR2 family protein n=1 Tax=Nocardia salmonicida TaxID=53431 RepID=UPI003678F939